ncbi:hypothetical protein ACFWYW_56095 [Nonomuraea sp. NPDC059023]|uniref:hypothetical protein n=1 Tax=unclassified Nonomuraea TaxID=2593643 RepID=UPI0036B4BFF2
MSAILLPDGVLRVPTTATLPDGTRIDGLRDIAPGEPDYDAWLPFAITEEQNRLGHADDDAILRRWHAAASA